MNKDERNPGAIDYFDRRIDNFDNIYNTNRRGLMAWLNRTLRASVRERFQMAFDLLGDIKGKSVLDIGCGTGRYMFEAVRRGAGDVVGLDAAPGAIEAARQMAGELGFDKRVEFIKSDFMDLQINRRYDIIFAVGYFDYILSPQPHLDKMLALCDGTLFASFPRRWHPMTPVRKIRLALNGCPVRFYSKKQIIGMMQKAEIDKFDLHKVYRDYVLLVKK
jgi:2-polyprenyl-3-methyl-5-hydroxy-6-metoxy-1,4-benzoquinol methylase